MQLTGANSHHKNNRSRAMYRHSIWSVTDSTHRLYGLAKMAVWRDLQAGNEVREK